MNEAGVGSRIASASSVGIAALLLTACGGGGTSVASTPSAPAVAATTPVVTPTPTPVVNYNTAEYARSGGAVQMQAISAYQKGATGSGITIAITDSGVDIQSSEFAGRISPASQDVVGGRSVDDDSGHGTSVAAVALAAKDDVNIHGVAFNATLLALRTDTPGSCSGTDGCSHADSALARAVDIAVANGARIVNMSLGGSGANLTLRNAIARATRAGVIFVISAGNDATADPDPLALVANDAPTANGLVVIAGSVGTASDPNAISTFSDRAGSGAAHYVAALGYRVRSFDHTGTNFLFSGTSYSAPNVSGALALILQAFPTMTSAQAVNILFSTADDAGATGVDPIYGNGIVNLARAFQPIGSTSLAGSAIPISTTDNATLGGAMGDGGQLGASLGGAVILDGYGRAFAVQLAQTINVTPTPLLLGSRLADRSHNASFGNGARVVSFTITPPTSTRPWVGLAQSGRDLHAGDENRVTHGFAASRTDPRTMTGFAYGYSADVLAGVLAGRESPAYLTSGPMGDSPLVQSGGVAGAVLRDAGKWRFGLSAGSADVSRLARLSPFEPTGLRSGAIGTVGVTASRLFGRAALTAGLSQMTESDTVLGAQAKGALGLAGATTTFATLEARARFGRWSLAAGTRSGWTTARLTGGLVSRLGSLRSTAWEGEVSRAGLFGNDRLSFRLAQPLRVEGGLASLSVPVDYDYATGLTSFEQRSVNLTPSGREIDAEAAYSVAAFGGSLDANLYLRREPGHVAARPDDVGAALRYAVAF